MIIPHYPDFVPLAMDLKAEMHPRLSLTADGVSEFTFSGLYLFRERYGYRVSRHGPESAGGFIISGTQPDSGHGRPGKFFMTPCGVPEPDALESLVATHDYWKNIPDAVFDPARETIEGLGIAVEEDRDNFDYLYSRNDLAELSGKKYHKKRNLVQQFLNSYEHEQRPLTRDLIPQAMEILDQWRLDKGEVGDYGSAREALELFDSLALRGRIFFVDGKPAGYCLGESVAKGRMFAIHFEKALDRYKGIFQFVNMAFARALPRFFSYINREQDLGDEGLRQAKMTYRPVGFVRKRVASRTPASRTAASPLA